MHVLFLDGERFHKDVTWIEHTVDIQWIVQNMKIYCKSWLTPLVILCMIHYINSEQEKQNDCNPNKR